MAIVNGKNCIDFVEIIHTNTKSNLESEIG